MAEHGTVAVAGVMLIGIKVGIYGLVRFVFPLLPNAVVQWQVYGSSRWAPQQVRIVLAFSVCRLGSHPCRNILSVLSHHHTSHRTVLALLTHTAPQQHASRKKSP